MKQGSKAANRDKIRTLKNGIDIEYDSLASIDILDREIFDESIYADHGIELNDGDCIFDVGANIGVFLLMLNEVLDHADVYSFEPIPRTFQILERNAGLHNRLKLRLFNCGLSNQAGRAQFVHYPRMSIASTMHPIESPEFRRNSRAFILEEMSQQSAVVRTIRKVTPDWSWYLLTELIRLYYQKGESVDCELTTLSNVVEAESVNQIDLLKIDVEGAEYEVLTGIRPEHWSRIGQIIVEVHDGVNALTSIVELLQEAGFDTSYEKLNEQVDHLFVVYGTRTDSRT